MKVHVREITALVLSHSCVRACEHDALSTDVLGAACSVETGGNEEMRKITFRGKKRLTWKK